MILLGDARRITLFVHGFAVFVGASVAVQRHRLIAD